MTQFTCKGVKQINNRISFKHLYHSYLSAFFISVEFQMGNFQKYWLQNVDQDFIVLDFFVGGEFVRDINVSRAWDPVHAGDKALTRRLPWKGGGLTGMPPKDHPCQVWFNLVQQFQRRRFKCDLLSKMPNLHNRHKSAERKNSQKKPRIYVKLLFSM